MADIVWDYRALDRIVYFVEFGLRKMVDDWRSKSEYGDQV